MTNSHIVKKKYCLTSKFLASNYKNVLYRQEMGGDEATDRIRRRLQALRSQKRFVQARVARRLKIADAAVTRYVNGPTPLTIAFLEAVAEESGEPLAEIVAPAESWRQLSPTEAEVVRALRRWPKHVTEALGEWLRFFSDEPSSDLQTRNLHALWRQAAKHKGARNRIYALAQLEAERALAPDTLAALERQLLDEAKRLRGSPTSTTKRRNGDDS